MYVHTIYSILPYFSDIYLLQQSKNITYNMIAKYYNYIYTNTGYFCYLWY